MVGTKKEMYTFLNCERNNAPVNPELNLTHFENNERSIGTRRFNNAKK